MGQQFLSRAEMVVVGLHHHWLNGIDYIGACKGKVRLYFFLPSMNPMNLNLFNMSIEDPELSR